MATRTTGRVIPVRGTEAERAAAEVAGKFLDGEFISTTDKLRVFLKATHISAGVWLGEVANAAARLGLNTSHARGCWPGDFCKQTDTSVLWFCVANHGASAGDWIGLTLNALVDPTTTAGDLIVRASGSLARLGVGAEGTVLKIVGGVPAWSTDLTGEGGGGSGNSIDQEIAADSPMAWWKCDEASGDLVDSSGNSYTLSAVGSSTYNRAAVDKRSSTKYLMVPSNTGTIYFSRAGTLGFTPPLNGSWTVAAIVRLEAGTSEVHRVFVVSAVGETEATNYQIYVGVAASGAPCVFWEYGAGTNYTYTSNKVAIPKGLAAHLAWVKDSVAKTVSFYVDGILADQTTYANEPTGGSSCVTSLGDPGQGSSGLTIAQLAVFNSVLAEARLRAYAVAAGFRMS